MPLVLKKELKFLSSFSEDDKDLIQSMIDDFRLRMGDDVPDKNLLNKKMEHYTDARIYNFLKTALDDLNGGLPKTHYSMPEFARISDNDLLILGAMVFALISEGILQVRNQVDFSDSGLSIAMFNKSPQYQGWASFILQTYMSAKLDWKNSLIARSPGSGFIGISSEFDFYGWW